MRWRTRILLACAIVPLVFVAIGVPLYVFPASDEPREVDAVFVIGPPTDERIAVAEQMVADGLTDTVMISVSTNDNVRWYAPRAYEMCVIALPEAQPDYTLYCDKPVPFTTRGEAHDLRDMVAEHGWESVAVVTFRPHLSRTRVIMERCWDGDIAYIDSGEPVSASEMAYNFLYQSGGFLKVATEGFAC